MVSDARKAQKQHDDELSVSSVRTQDGSGDYQIYSITGERLSAPRRGEIHIVRYADGTVKKVVR
ncbi:MAG: hypothetical protein LUC45_09630 [Paraprevotella sp.]|nr:hypothetical protein [Paraprevotella sp.]